MNWQPIETAPKDGTEVLYYGPKGMLIGNEFPGYFRGLWASLNGEPRGFAVSAAMAATHWMPLPEPPRAEK